MTSEYDTARCCYKLLDSDLFVAKQEYVRRQILYCLLQVCLVECITGRRVNLTRSQEDDDANVVYVAAAILLFDGRNNEGVFEMMQAEGAFARLVGLIHDKRGDGTTVHRLLLELLYNMSRTQPLNRDDLGMRMLRFLETFERHTDSM